MSTYHANMNNIINSRQNSNPAGQCPGGQISWLDYHPPFIENISSFTLIHLSTGRAEGPLD